MSLIWFYPKSKLATTNVCFSNVNVSSSAKCSNLFASYLCSFWQSVKKISYFLLNLFVQSITQHSTSFLVLNVFLCVWQHTNCPWGKATERPCPNRELNPGPPYCKATVPTSEPLCCHWFAIDFSNKNIFIALLRKHNCFHMYVIHFAKFPLIYKSLHQNKIVSPYSPKVSASPRRKI